MDLDEFSDDGFDDLTDNALQELENHALRLTQAQQAQQAIAQQPDQFDYAWGQEDDDLDTTEVINDAGVPVGRPIVDKTLRRQRRPQPARPSIPPVPNPRWNPAIDSAAARSGAPLAERSRITSVRPLNQPFAGSQRFPDSSQMAAPRPQATQLPVPSQGQSATMVTALQKRIRVLEAELNAARGEASILRSNSTKAQQSHDEQIARLRRLNAEQLEKQGKAMEAALAAEKHANTELQFLQRDMREANDRARKKDPAAAGATTPKKAAKTWGFADGFDQMDIAASPSKGQGRSKAAGSVAANIGERTPSKGKRKRPVSESPMKALDIHTGDAEMSEAKPASQLALQQPVVVATPTVPFDFLQIVLDHGYAQGQPPTFDILSRISFPSDPATSFSTLIFERLPLMGNPYQPMQLLVDFAEQIIILWTRCFEEQFWEPIKYLVSLISFTFQLNTSSVAPLIISRLVPVAQTTIFTVAEGPLRTSDGTAASNDEYAILEQQIDTTHILSLLYTASLACAMTPAETEDGIKYTPAAFWKLISLDFTLLLLMPKQKAVDIIGMLDLLATSSLPDSVGPISDEKDAPSVARAVIERVSAKLVEHPRATTAPAQKRSVRLAALRTLIAFARHEFGARQLASHDNALPRLVACLSTSIDELYDQPIPPSVLPPLPDSIASSSLKFAESTTSAELNRIISQCVTLIHTLVTDPCTANLADITRKLSLSHGGSQRYLIALGRLTFAEEDLVMEAGIEGEVVEAAHELLEMAVTPDEGEIVSEAFGA
ncbi:dna repair rad26 [Trichoderma cornu-damae]|uniref:Dna repair rad26 n=1 Tax=Trichoderma cornu-damae TaxID=654480 RepID=A0A9P8TZA1_9HYPO|nr:dna repair rad26 [Trichoderma cornu-damae]